MHGPGASSRIDTDKNDDDVDRMDRVVVIKGFEPFSTRDEITTIATKNFGSPDSISGAKENYFTFAWRGDFCMLEFDNFKTKMQFQKQHRNPQQDGELSLRNDSLKTRKELKMEKAASKLESNLYT